MERCKGDFYVFLVRNLRFSRSSCTFSVWETYGFAQGNVECGSQFVSLCRWILLFLCGGVNVTGFEPATTRPPDAYSNRAELHPELRMQRYCFILNLQVFCAILFMPIL